MQNEIHHFLSSNPKDWAAGAILLAKNSKNKSLISIITKKIDQQRYQAKLLHELHKIAGTKVKPLIPAQRKHKPKPLIRKTVSNQTVKALIDNYPERFTQLEFSRLPEQIQQLEKSRKELFKSRAFLKARLELFPTDLERHEAALLILQMGTQLDQAYADLDYYKLHRILPASVEVDQLEPADLALLERQLKLCGSRISKAKKNTSRNEKQEAKYQADLVLKAELAEKIRQIAIQTE